MKIWAPLQQTISQISHVMIYDNGSENTNQVRVGLDLSPTLKDTEVGEQVLKTINESKQQQSFKQVNLFRQEAQKPTEESLKPIQEEPAQERLIKPVLFETKNSDEFKNLLDKDKAFKNEIESLIKVSKKTDEVEQENYFYESVKKGVKNDTITSKVGPHHRRDPNAKIFDAKNDEDKIYKGEQNTVYQSNGQYEGGQTSSVNQQSNIEQVKDSTLDKLEVKDDFYRSADDFVETKDKPILQSNKQQDNIDVQSKSDDGRKNLNYETNNNDVNVDQLGSRNLMLQSDFSVLQSQQSNYDFNPNTKIEPIKQDYDDRYYHVGSSDVQKSQTDLADSFKKPRGISHINPLMNHNYFRGPPDPLNARRNRAQKALYEDSGRGSKIQYFPTKA